MSNHHAKLLDCTLRDGAYLIDKKFGNDTINGMIHGLLEAKIDIIEMGFLQNEGFGEGKTVYLNGADAEKFVPKDKQGTLFTVLADYSRYSVSNLDQYTGKSFDAVRACFFKKERKDVINAIHGCGNASQNPKPGFNIKLNIGDFNDGVYTLKLAVFSSNGKVIATDERKVEINKYKATGCIDIPIPLGQARKTLYVSGWVMTNDKDSKIKMYIDEKEQKINNLKRVEREDVIKAIPGYGGKESNPTPGYKAEIDVSKFSDGIHTLKVESVSSEGTVMYSENQRIVIYNNYGFGIDVSKHNGNIDWAKVKESGVNFAIVRVGNRGYGAEGNLVTDPKFVDNMKGAISNGIDVGVYFYSQAITESEAIEEADMTLKLIKENGFEGKIKYPIIIDTEKSGGRADILSKESRTAVVKAFCERVKKAGYEPMIYANKDWLINNLNMNQLESYDVWVAHYNNTTDPIKNPTDYKGKYQIWQYTSTGKINGISGDVDLNIGYKKYL